MHSNFKAVLNAKTNGDATRACNCRQRINVSAWVRSNLTEVVTTRRPFACLNSPDSW